MMVQAVPCPRCGLQNAAGQNFCGACGERLTAICPSCLSNTTPSARFCSNCGSKLYYPTQRQGYHIYGQQPIQPPVETPSYQQWQYEHEEERPKQKRTNSGFIGCLGIIAIVFLIGGAISVLREPSSAAPRLPEYIHQYENKQPQIIGSARRAPHLINNSGAKSVSFAELRSFIRRDTTDAGLYLEGVRDCVDFAEQLHNNAEAAGIKAALVTVNFAGEGIGHALNAFKTTDRGLIYIDCTGKGLKFVSSTTTMGEKISLLDKPRPGDYDRIAYIEKNRQYGVINIDKAESLDYGFYVEYNQNWQKLDAMIDDFNDEVDAFNRALGGRTALAEPEYSKFKAWETRLDGKKQTILGLADKLGKVWFKPLGIVETVKIYW